MWNVKGSINASAVGAEMPGRMPMMKPMTTPIIINKKVVGANTDARPLPSAPKYVAKSTLF
jgi:hypothetical protein